jgi:glycosyltransferase involved in cell wall biosynthesis
MKILLLLSRIETTGVTTHTLDLAEGLVAKGHEVCLITGGIYEKESARVNHFYDAFKKLGVTIKEFETPKGNILKKGYTSFATTFQIIKWINDFDPKVIHAQSPYLTFLPWLMGKKFTTTIHILYLKRNFKFKNPQHLIAISQESHDFSLKEFGMDKKDITIVHHGVSSRFANPVCQDAKNQLKQKHNIAQDKVIVGFVGSLSLRKGTDILVNALKDLKEETKRNIQFIFLGGLQDSDEHVWLKNMLAEANLCNLAHLVPFEDPKPFYDIMDVFVLPSRMESFPLVTLEAMMSSCCVIRSNTEGAYEQIDHGATGLLFNNEDHTQLTELLEKVISSKTLREQLGTNAKEKALRKFTIPAMTERTLKVYDKIHNN